jgi:hypothetical protein
VYPDGARQCFNVLGQIRLVIKYMYCKAGTHVSLTPDGPGVEPDRAKHLVQARLERRVRLEVVRPHWHVRVYVREERVRRLLPHLLYLLP